MTLMLLELLQVGMLSYQSLHSQGDFVQDYLVSEEEQCIRFISRVFCFSHAKFPNPLSLSTHRIDSDLLKFCSIVMHVK